MNSPKDETIVIEIKSPGIDFNWKLIKKKQKQMDDRIISRQRKLTLISFTVQISETLPSNLINFSFEFTFKVSSTYEFF